MKVNKKFLLLILIILGFLLRIIVSPYYTHSSDMHFWNHWAKEIDRLGFYDFFNKVGWTDYLPFYFYILFILEKIIQTFHITGNLIFKVPGILADMATAYLIYLIARNLKLKYSLILPSIYLFNPAIFGNSAMWGQVDGIGAFLVVLCLYLFLKQKLMVLGIFMAMAILFKPLYLLLLPIFLLAQLKYNNLTRVSIKVKAVKQIFRFEVLKKLCAIFCSTIIGIFILIAPFTKDLISIPSLIIDRYTTSLEQYKYASVNAFNFWSFIGKNFKSDQHLFSNITYQHWGLIIFGFIIGISFLTFFFKNFRNLSQYSQALILILAISYISLFTFTTRVHERHLLTFFPFLAILFSSGWSYSITYVATSFLYVINLYFGILHLQQRGVTLDDRTIQHYSIAVVFFCLFLIFQFWYKNWFNHEKVS